MTHLWCQSRQNLCSQPEPEVFSDHCNWKCQGFFLFFLTSQSCGSHRCISPCFHSEPLLLPALPAQRCVCEIWPEQLRVWLHSHWLLWRKLHRPWVPQCVFHILSRHIAFGGIWKMFCSWDWNSLIVVWKPTELALIGSDTKPVADKFPSFFSRLKYQGKKNQLKGRQEEKSCFQTASNPPKKYPYWVWQPVSQWPATLCHSA